MASRPVEIGPAGLHSARAIERIRLARGLTQHQLAVRCTALGRPMTNVALSRTERARRRCDVDDLVAIATALGVPPETLLLPLALATAPHRRGC
ncbi:helix-turn-helix domain-containing protein [Streptomyces europaeiscabiei]|uniref:helix-turn-helix domain-containing protein n=1 Tax=Streptomyces europaeiscabiei TaxID=146819 RepID=UPI0029AE3354|nr:helix-turn-helix transcriptional regulator [Streptomyces europaeiscabiei]MDX2768312.1 helix-turn-helix transcriptional regulator [Streptomyces europaeiscabiei]MDX3611972.1 helix-turn-helix transcriptional regulator [Streptomyces europaeiscabiei]